MMLAITCTYSAMELNRREGKNSPCICPIINSLSNLSVPARMSSLPPRASRNFLLSPMNQFSQNGFVAARFVLQTHGLVGSEGFDSSWSNEGTEMRAEVLLRIVRDRVLVLVLDILFLFLKRDGLLFTYCHSIPEDIEGNLVGRVERYCSMLCRASIAEPGGESCSISNGLVIYE